MKLPEGEDLNEWLAVHSTPFKLTQSLHHFQHFLAVDFFNHLNMLYGTVTEFCIPSEVCPSYLTIRRKLMLIPFSVPNYVCRTTVRFIHIATFLRIYLRFRYEYLWEDGVKYRRPTKLPAPEYVDSLMNWVQALLDDDAIFPNKIGPT